MSYTIVEYEPRFKPELLSVQRNLWSDDTTLNAAYFEWKYERNPFLEPLVRVAVCDGRVVGMRGMWGSRWEVGQPPQRFLVPCAGDLVVAPEHRRQGLAAALIEDTRRAVADRGYPYTFSLSASLVTQFALHTAGWRSAAVLETVHHPSLQQGIGRRVRAYVAPLARTVARRLTFLRRVASRVASRPPAGAPRPFNTLDQRVAGPPRRGTPISVERGPRPDAMADLVARVGTGGRLRHVRDPAYLSWRFLNPRRAYRFLFWSDRELEGYLVLQAGGRRSPSVVNIVDWEATNHAVRTNLLQAAIRWGDFTELATWSVSLHADTRSLLRDAGFVTLSRPESIGQASRAKHRPSQLLVRAVSKGDEQNEWALGGRRLLDPENWDLRMIYSDNF